MKGKALELKSGSDPDFRHPIFAPFRPWLDKLDDFSLERLNSISEIQNLSTLNGKPIRFVPPSGASPSYEMHVFETGQVQTRAGNLHDLFNALVWLAFPKTKARINAMHAAEIPRERDNNGGRRGRLRDMLTIFDEGGAIVACSSEVAALARQARWSELFLAHHRGLRIVVLGHAVLEQSLKPHPGITCKVIFADPSRELDAQAAAWLANEGRTPGDLPPLPVFGYPGWYECSDPAHFYADQRYFRPLREERGEIGL